MYLPQPGSVSKPYRPAVPPTLQNPSRETGGKQGVQKLMILDGAESVGEVPSQTQEAFQMVAPLRPGSLRSSPFPPGIRLTKVPV